MKMEEWKECTVGDICSKITSGGTPKSSNSSYYNGSIPWLNTKEVNFNRIFSTEKTITQDGYDNSSAKWIPENSVIVAMYGATAGRVAISKIDLTTNQACCNLIIDSSKADYQFVYYHLYNSYTHLSSLANGGAQQNLNANQIREYPIKLPPLPTQQKIAAILSSLDDKIELNNKINTNLEQQAGVIFKNFSEKSSKSVKFTDLIYILGGGTPKTHNEDYWNGNIPFFTPKDVGNPYCLLTEKTITESGLDNCNSRLYPVNTIFVTARGTVGKISLAGLPMAMNQSCYALKSKDDNQLLAYFYTLEAINSLKHKANGATFDAIVTRDFETETINVLSEQYTKEFTQIVKPIFEKILTNQKENINLSNLRDTLLPKLMNEEIFK